MVVKFKLFSLLFFVISAFPNISKSQDLLTLNSKVRVSAPNVIGGLITGELARLDQDSVAVMVDKRLIVLQRSSIEKFWRLSGEKGHALIGGVIGLPVGALAGLGFSAVLCKENPDGGGGLDLCNVFGFLVGAGGGLILGALIGSTVRTESWEKVDVNKVSLGVGMINNRTAGIKLSWTF